MVKPGQLAGGMWKTDLKEAATALKGSWVSARRNHLLLPGQTDGPETRGRVPKMEISHVAPRGPSGVC